MTAGQQRLGALLVDMGFIDDGQLESALDEQKRTGKRLGKILVESSIMTEDRLVHALSRQLGLEACDPIMTPVHPKVLELIPPEIAFKHRVLPVARQMEDQRECLYVATSDPLDRSALDAIRKVVGTASRVKWMLAGETEMDLALARHYGTAPKGASATAAAVKAAPTAPVSSAGRRRTSTPPRGMQVIQGVPISGPPHLPGDESRSLSMFSNTDDIFAALQDAVERNAGDDAGAPDAPQPLRTSDLIPASPSLDISYRPDESSASKGQGLRPVDSSPRLALLRLGGEVDDEIADEILEAEEVIESGVYPPPHLDPDDPVIRDSMLPSGLQARGPAPAGPKTPAGKAAQPTPLPALDWGELLGSSGPVASRSQSGGSMDLRLDTASLPDARKDTESLPDATEDFDVPIEVEEELEEERYQPEPPPTFDGLSSGVRRRLREAAAEADDLPEAEASISLEQAPEPEFDPEAEPDEGIELDGGTGSISLDLSEPEAPDVPEARVATSDDDEEDEDEDEAEPAGEEAPEVPDVRVRSDVFTVETRSPTWDERVRYGAVTVHSGDAETVLPGPSEPEDAASTVAIERHTAPGMPSSAVEVREAIVSFVTGEEIDDRTLRFVMRIIAGVLLRDGLLDDARLERLLDDLR